MPNEGPIGVADTRRLIHGYYAATSYMDAQVGRVLDSMDELKLWESTIVLLWGDHGWHLGDHGMWCKHTNYEQATRIPVIVAAPTLASNAKTAAMIETVDIYPTLCELSGLPVPAGLDGKSFAQVLKSPDSPGRESVTHVYPRSQLLGRAIRTPRYRLVEWKQPGAEAATGEFELYDYEVDPQETKNLAAENPALVQQLRRLLAEQPEARPPVTSGKVSSKTSSPSGDSKKKAGGKKKKKAAA
jgi:iduronate 2-sulfatase